MTVLTSILNGSSNKDIRDTWNKALADIRTLQTNGTPTPSPTPTPTPTPSTFTMTQLPSAYRTYQRSTKTGGGPGKGRGSIAVTLNVTTATPIYARCRATDGTILQAAWQVTANQAAGVGPVTITDIDARAGFHYLDLSHDGVTWQNGTTLVQVGRVVFWTGQSLMVRMFARMDGQTETLASLGVTPSAAASVCATYVDSRSNSNLTWALPTDGSAYDSAGVAEFLRLQVLTFGVGCSVVSHSKGGEGIGYFAPGGAGNAQVRAALDATGGFEAALLFQGHSDSASGTTSAGYKAGLTSLFGDMTSRNAVLGNAYERYLCTIPNIYNSNWGDAAAIALIRKAARDWAAANSGVTVQPTDLELVDGVHQTMAGARTAARHFHRATRPAAGLPRSDAGSSLGQGTRAAGTKVLKLPLTLSPGATTIALAAGSQTPNDRFSVYPTGTVTNRRAVTGVAVSSSEVQLTLQNLDADTVAYDVYFDRSPETTIAMYYDDATDGDGITTGRQLAVTLEPVLVPAASGGTAVPSNTAVPVITGTPQAGQQLAVSNGAWSNNPTSYAYQWRWADTGQAIAGATAATYTPVSGDVGHTLACTVVASNAGGASSGASSAASAAIAAAGLTKVGPDFADGGITFAANPTTDYGQRRTAGRASYANSDALFPQSGYTMEMLVSAAAPPGGLQVIAGEVGRFYLLMDSDGSIQIQAHDASGNEPRVGGGGSKADGATHHVAWVTSATTCTLYIDGVAVGSRGGGVKASNAGGTLGIGYFGGNGFDFGGTIDEFAIRSGQRYTGAFTPPTAPFVGSEGGFLSLLHLNGNTNAAQY